MSLGVAARTTLSFHFVLALVLVYGTSFLFRFLEHYDVPILAVEMLAGIVFGSLLGLVSTSTPGYAFLLDLASFGLLMIMFDAGLELNPEIIQQNPLRIAKIALLTFLFPFVSGVGLALAIGLHTFAAFLVGVTVSTTSLGLVYPLLEDFDLIATGTGQLLLSVAVMNDILSVAALAYGITLLNAPRPVLGVVTVTAALAFFFLVLPFYLDDRLSNRLKEGIVGNPVKAGVFTMVVLAYLMEQIGVHAILGAFFAGLLVSAVTHEGHSIQQSMKPVSWLATPVFFFYVGMNFSVDSFWSTSPIVLVTVLVIGLGSKVVGSLLAGWLSRLDRHTTSLLASAMPGRLSISVAAAEIGLRMGVISRGLYDAFIILSVLSVFVSVFSFRYFATGAGDVDATSVAQD